MVATVWTHLVSHSILEHIVHCVHNCALCALCALTATLFTRVHKRASFIFMCVAVHFVHGVYFVH